MVPAAQQVGNVPLATQRAWKVLAAAVAGAGFQAGRDVLGWGLQVRGQLVHHGGLGWPPCLLNRTSGSGMEDCAGAGICLPEVELFISGLESQELQARPADTPLYLSILSIDNTKADML